MHVRFSLCKSIAICQLSLVACRMTTGLSVAPGRPHVELAIWPASAQVSSRAWPIYSRSSGGSAMDSPRWVVVNLELA